jgi:hypothetical protein
MDTARAPVQFAAREQRLAGAPDIMKQNHLYLLIGILVALVVVLGIYVLREESQPSGIELRIDDSGIAIEEN